MSPAARLEAVAVPGLPELGPDDDLAALLVGACAAAGLTLRDDDVLAVASKVVAKVEGRAVAAGAREDVVAGETVRVVAERLLPDGRVTRVVQTRSGPVLAAAGVDASDVAAGTVLRLPADPDASARRLRARVRDLAGVAPAVLVTDSAGRPWREGVADFALGAAGLRVLDDLRGRPDRFGRPLDVTVRAVADEVAALADLVKGKAAGTPVAVVRGLGAWVSADDGPGAAGCVRVGAGDWFGSGQVEAVRRSLGVEPGAVVPPPLDPARDPVTDRVARAVQVAVHGGAAAGVELEVGAAAVALRGDPLRVGVVAQRLVAALWAEGVEAGLDLAATPPAVRLAP